MIPIVVVLLLVGLAAVATAVYELIYGGEDKGSALVWLAVATGSVLTAIVIAYRAVLFVFGALRRTQDSIKRIEEER